MKRAKVLLLCGGQSGEHEVSLSSARSVIAAAGQCFEVTPLVIDKTGRLLPAEASQKALEAGRSEGVTATGASLQTLSPTAFDVVFPLLHGPMGEDGSIQGMLKLMGLPFVGSDVLGSAVGMDKLMMKSVFAAHGLPQTRYQAVKRTDWHDNPQRVLESLTHLNYPLFVKPANLGSSVGISKASDEESLRTALDEAARHDRRIVVEEGVKARELEVGVLGNDKPRVSPVGEIVFESDFYDYETKYTEGRSSAVIPAHVPDHIAEECQALALKAFEALDAAGLSRVDFFYDEAADRLYINEINTMPGFTVTSMYPKLWEAAGVSYPELVVKLVELALERR